MGKGSYRIALHVGDSLYRLTRIIFGGDGSFYVAAPVHPSERAALAKITVNYATSETAVPFDETVDLADLVAEDKEIKYSHHPDGFIQFSGAGVTSGRDEDGTIRGMGVDSWPLWDPIRGPAFGLAITSIEQFGAETKETPDTVVFDDDDIVSLPGFDQIAVAGYYFPPMWRRFIRRDHRGRLAISIFHPAKAVLQLRVILPPEKLEFPGFMGLEVYTQWLRSEDAEPNAGFILSGSTGNLRRNDAGELLGEGIYCFYPAEDMPQAMRNLDYVQDYLMKEVDPQRTDGKIAAKPSMNPKTTGPETL